MTHSYVCHDSEVARELGYNTQCSALSRLGVYVLQCVCVAVCRGVLQYVAGTVLPYCILVCVLVCVSVLQFVAVSVAVR